MVCPVLSLSQMAEEGGVRLSKRMAGRRRQQKVVFGIRTVVPKVFRASLELNQIGTVVLGIYVSLTLSSTLKSVLHLPSSQLCLF